MTRIDPVLRIVWLIIGIALLAWLGLARGPQEWRRWEARREYARRPPGPPREPGIIVGGQAAADRAAGVRRQGLRCPQVIDPCRPAAGRREDPRPYRDDDWLVVPVVLATFSQPLEADMAMEIALPIEAYTWKPSGPLGGYHGVGVDAVNLVFCRRDGRGTRLLLDRPAWVRTLYIPEEPGRPYLYDLAVADTNGDDRLDGMDGLTLWRSATDGSGLVPVWLPAGDVAPTSYREPLSGDLFGTVTRDTDGDGRITEYDRPALFRVALGDTTARMVVPDSVMARIEGIVFGDGGR